MKYKIQKNIPFPGRLDQRTIYPFAQMKIGDSFLVPELKARSAQSCAAAYSRKKKGKIKFSTRTVGKSLRVWRVK